MTWTHAKELLRRSKTSQWQSCESPFPPLKTLKVRVPMFFLLFFKKRNPMSLFCAHLVWRLREKYLYVYETSFIIQRWALMMRFLSSFFFTCVFFGTEKLYNILLLNIFQVMLPQDLTYCILETQQRNIYWLLREKKNGVSMLKKRGMYSKVLAEPNQYNSTFFSLKLLVLMKQ